MANRETVRATAENSTATGRTIAKTPASPSGSIVGSEPIPPAAVPGGSAAAAAAPEDPKKSAPPRRALPAIDATTKNIEANDPVSTRRNFPSTRSSRATGLQSSVSIVPRSFSPAVISIAG